MSHLYFRHARAMSILFCRQLPAVCLLLLLALVCALPVRANPPAGDPNQPYDQLPGTLETFHVKWANPLTAGETKLKVLFILPYKNSRQVVDLAQRVEMDYTVIMCAGHKRWHQGYYDGTETSALTPDETLPLLADLCTGATHGRLTLPGGVKRYDVIVIGKVNWNMLPADVRSLVLQHLQLGTGVVYVSPGLVAAGSDPAPFTLTTDETNQFTALFGTGASPDTNSEVTRALPFDLMRIKVVTDAQYASLPAAPQQYLRFYQQPLTVRLATLGTGRIVDLDYHDANQEYGSSLTPEVKFDQAKYDLDYTVLARAVLYAAGKSPATNVRASITTNFPTTSLSVPAADLEYTVTGWDVKSPATLVAWTDLGSATITFATQGTPPAGTKLEYGLRDSAGVLLKGGTPPANGVVALPILPRGNYTADMRVVDSNGRVLDFASKAFRVEGEERITTVTTDKSSYDAGQTIQGTVNFYQALPTGHTVTAYAIDTWQRVVAKVAVTLAGNRLSGTFSIPVANAKSRLWDIQCRISATAGPVDAKTMWVGLPNWSFDDYTLALIFSAFPDYSWKGDLYTRVVRPFGVNANNVQLIHSQTWQYELGERYHLASISYAEHYGQGAVTNNNYTIEASNWCMGKWGRVAQHLQLNGSGQPYLDDPNMDYTWGQWNLNAAWMINRIPMYKEALKFGTPYFWLAGEEQLSGDLAAQENSCFCDYCTGNFRTWCQQQYNNSLAALNTEWNTTFTDWSQVRGILYPQAVAQNQLPRWVDFRFFMRSQVWTQFFIDYTDMMRRTMQKADLRTGTNGFDHYDFTRLTNHMTCAKVYGANLQTINSEWKDSVLGEIRQSFSSDQSFLLAPQCMRLWNDDFKTTQDQQRMPWKFLFAGYRGFDWEVGSQPYNSMGGFSCITPDGSQPLPFFQTISQEVQELQRGIGKLANTAQQVTAPVAILWAPYDHYISRILPTPANMGKFSGSWMSNVVVDGGAVSDCLVQLRALHLRPVFVSPADVTGGLLQTMQIKVLLLPYNKGMSEAEATAIRAFVQGGGTVIADNEPGTYTEHGRALGANRRLADLFPDLTKQNVITQGLGTAAYMPNRINGYLSRFQTDDYPYGDALATPVTINSTTWTLVTHTLKVGNSFTAAVGVRPVATGDVTIDDLAITANKIGNSSFEESRMQSLSVEPFLSQRNGGCNFGTNDPAPIPVNFDSFVGQCQDFLLVADAHTGSNALKFHGGFNFKEKFAAQTGQSFRVQYYAKSVAGWMGFRFVLMVYNASGGLLAQMVPTQSFINTTWTLVSTDWTITAANAAYFTIRTDASADGIIDDVVVQRTDSAALSNGSFETVTNQALDQGQFLQAINQGWDLGTQNPAPFPSNFGQFILNGSPGRFITTADARTGTHALRINGGFQLTDHLAATIGDTVTISYYAKGNGTVKMDLELFDANQVYLGQSVSSLISAAGVTPGVDLQYNAGPRAGLPRLDTLTSVYQQGTARYVGLLKQALSPATDDPSTLVKLPQYYYVYDMRAHTYLGFVNSFPITLEKSAKFYALLPAQPTGITLTPDRYFITQGQTVTLTGAITFDNGSAEGMGQVAHLTVTDPDGREVECCRDNIIFTGSTFTTVLPVSFAEKHGVYTVTAEYPITGATAVTHIEVRPEAYPNLFSNTGLEQVHAQMLNVFPFTLWPTVDYGTTGNGPVDIPNNFDQMSGCTRFIMTPNAHSGSHALLFNGAFYFNDQITAHYGDQFRIRYHAKGQGTVGIMVMFYTANWTAVGSYVPAMTTLSTTNWTQVTHAFTVTGTNADMMILRPMTANGDVTIDDIVVEADPSELMTDNPSFESVHSQMLNVEPFLTQKNLGCDFGTGGNGPVNIPDNFGQFTSDCLRFIVTSSGAHTGSRALNFTGSFDLSNQFSTVVGDEYTLRYYAKGHGTVKILPRVYDVDGNLLEQLDPRAVTLDTSAWTLVTQTVQVKSSHAHHVLLRLVATGSDLTIDDISVRKWTAPVTQELPWLRKGIN
ncbi:MAG TPA: alpha-amylase family protein [Armatimonadota bacterium]